MRLTTRELRLETRRVETGGSSEAGVWQTSYSNRLERRGDTNKKRVRLQKKGECTHEMLECVLLARERLMCGGRVRGGSATAGEGACWNGASGGERETGTEHGKWVTNQHVRERPTEVARLKPAGLRSRIVRRSASICNIFQLLLLWSTLLFSNLLSFGYPRRQT